MTVNELSCRGRQQSRNKSSRGRNRQRDCRRGVELDDRCAEGTSRRRHNRNFFDEERDVHASSKKWKERGSPPADNCGKTRSSTRRSAHDNSSSKMLFTSRSEISPKDRYKTIARNNELLNIFEVARNSKNKDRLPNKDFPKLIDSKTRRIMDKYSKKEKSVSEEKQLKLFDFENDDENVSYQYRTNMKGNQSLLQHKCERVIDVRDNTAEFCGTPIICSNFTMILFSSESFLSVEKKEIQKFSRKILKVASQATLSVGEQVHIAVEKTLKVLKEIDDESKMRLIDNGGNSHNIGGKNAFRSSDIQIQGASQEGSKRRKGRQRKDYRLSTHTSNRHSESNRGKKNSACRREWGVSRSTLLN